MKVIGIIGTRRRNSIEDFLIVEEKFLELYYRRDYICSGKCPKGGDRFAEILSEKNKIPIITYTPDWKKYGRIAGFLRNTAIAKTSDVLIACVAPDRKGGTEDTIAKFIGFHGYRNLHIV